MVLPHDVATPSSTEFFNALRPRLETWAARLAEEGFEPLRRAWLSRAQGLGHQVRVLQGDQALEGRVAGLSARGARVTLRFPEGADRLSQALTQQGLSLRNVGGNWVLGLQ